MNKQTEKRKNCGSDQSNYFGYNLAVIDHGKDVNITDPIIKANYSYPFDEECYSHFSSGRNRKEPLLDIRNASGDFNISHKKSDRPGI